MNESCWEQWRRCGRHGHLDVYEIRDDPNGNGKRFVSQYAMTALTVDLVISNGHQILLIERGHPPCQGQWALPGGFVDIGENESPQHAAHRELHEETGLQNVELHLITARANATRDPRGYTTTMIYAGRIEESQAIAQTSAGDDAAKAQWFAMDQLPDLAFDHEEIVTAVTSSCASVVQLFD